jgi:lipopolysaccharide transport system permease protein
VVFTVLESVEGSVRSLESKPAQVGTAHASSTPGSQTGSSQSLIAPYRSAWINRALITRLTKREIEARYRGTLLGFLWLALVPIIMLGVYAFVFSVVFETKWAVAIEGRGDFVLLLFTGLIIFNFFAECLNRAPSLVLANVAYVKKVVFPLEILTWVAILTALFNAAISATVLAIAFVVLRGLPPIEVLYLPLILAPIALFALGITHILSSIGVFVRDLQQVTGLMTMVLMFMSPLFYPLSALSPQLQKLMGLSPIAVTIEQSRAVLFQGLAPDLVQLGVMLLSSAVVAWLGHLWFIKTKKGFADVV